MLRVAIIFCVIVQSSALWPNYSPCPILPSQPVVPALMMGQWYSYARSSNINDRTSHCGKLTLTPIGKPKGIFSDMSTLIHSSTSVVAELEPSDLTVLIMRIHIPVLGIITQRHHVLQTDYFSYNIIWACEQYESQYRLAIYVNTRTKKPPNNIDRIIETAFKLRGLPSPSLTRVDQSCSN